MKFTDELLEQIANNTFQGDSLDLSYAFVSKPRLKRLAEALSKNKTINKINLSGNDIDDEGAKILADSLKARPPIEGLELIIAVNRIRVDGVKEIASIGHLSSLNLSGNEFSSLSIKFLADHPTLVNLNLSDNNVSDKDLQLFENNGRLKELNLASCNLEGTNLKPVVNIPTLTNLILSSNPITSEALAVIEGNSNLQSIDLSFTSINNRCLTHLSKTNLKEIDLCSGLISDIGLVDLFRKNSTIEKLQLSQTKVTKECATKIILENEKLEEVTLNSGTVNRPPSSRKLVTSNTHDSFFKPSAQPSSQDALPAVVISIKNHFLEEIKAIKNESFTLSPAQIKQLFESMEQETANMFSTSDEKEQKDAPLSSPMLATTVGNG